MQMSTAVETENGEMIVKRVSVPVGLEELMEGLTKEVLLKKPKDIYVFASEYFARLLSMRERGNYEVSKQLRQVQSVSRQISKAGSEKLLAKSILNQQPKQVIRAKSPPKLTASSKKIPLLRKSSTQNAEKRENERNRFRSKRAVSNDEYSSSPRKEEEKSSGRNRLKERSLSTTRRNGSNDSQKKGTVASQIANKKSSSKKDDPASVQNIITPAIIGGSLAAVAVSNKIEPKSLDASNNNNVDKNVSDTKTDQGKLESLKKDTNDTLDNEEVSSLSSEKTGSEKTINDFKPENENSKEELSEKSLSDKIGISSSDISNNETSEYLSTDNLKVEEVSSELETSSKKEDLNETETPVNEKKDQSSADKTQGLEILKENDEQELQSKDENNKSDSSLLKKEVNNTTETPSTVQEKSDLSDGDAVLKEVGKSPKDSQQGKANIIKDENNIVNKDPNKLEEVITNVSSKEEIGYDTVDNKAEVNSLPLKQENVSEISKKVDNDVSSNIQNTETIANDMSSNENPPKTQFQKSEKTYEAEAENIMCSSVLGQINDENTSKDTTNHDSERKEIKDDGKILDSEKANQTDKSVTENILNSESIAIKTDLNNDGKMPLKTNDESGLVESSDNMNLNDQIETVNGPSITNETDKEIPAPINVDKNDKNVVNSTTNAISNENKKQAIDEINQSAEIIAQPVNENEVIDQTNDEHASSTIDSSKCDKNDVPVESVNLPNENQTKNDTITKAIETSDKKDEEMLTNQNLDRKQNENDINQTSENVINYNEEAEKENQGNNDDSQDKKGTELQNSSLEDNKNSINATSNSTLEVDKQQITSFLTHECANVDKNVKTITSESSSIEKSVSKNKLVMEKNDKLPPRPKLKNTKTRSLSHENLIKKDSPKENNKTEKQVRRIKSMDVSKKSNRNNKSLSADTKLKSENAKNSKLSSNRKDKEIEENLKTKEDGENRETLKSNNKTRVRKSLSTTNVDSNRENKMNKETSFDISKLRNELNEVETTSKLTSFKSSYNPYILRQEIKSASKNNDTVKENIFTEMSAALKIQSIWRGFIVRRNRKKMKTENRQLEVQKEPNISTTNTEENKIANAAILIQKLWRGFHIRKIRKEASLFGNKVEEVKQNAEVIKSTDDFQVKTNKSALKIQSLWRGYQVRKNINNVNKKWKELTNDDGNNKVINDSDIIHAATKIQAGVRGYLQRKKNKSSNLSNITEENLDRGTPSETSTSNGKIDGVIDNNSSKSDSSEMSKTLQKCETVEEPECVREHITSTTTNDTNSTKDDNNNENNLTVLEREVKDAVANISNCLKQPETTSFNINDLRREIHEISQETHNSLETITNTSDIVGNKLDCSVNKCVPDSENSNKIDNLKSIPPASDNKKIDPDSANDVYENAPTRPATSDTVNNSVHYENNQSIVNHQKIQTDSNVNSVENTNSLPNGLKEQTESKNISNNIKTTITDKDKNNSFDIEQLRRDLEETNNLLTMIPNFKDTNSEHKQTTDKLNQVNKESDGSDSVLINSNDNFCSTKIKSTPIVNNEIKADVELVPELHPNLPANNIQIEKNVNANTDENKDSLHLTTYEKDSGQFISSNNKDSCNNVETNKSEKDDKTLNKTENNVIEEINKTSSEVLSVPLSNSETVQKSEIVSEPIGQKKSENKLPTDIESTIKNEGHVATNTHNLNNESHEHNIQIEDLDKSGNKEICNEKGVDGKKSPETVTEKVSDLQNSRISDDADSITVDAADLKDTLKTDTTDNPRNNTVPSNICNNVSVSDEKVNHELNHSQSQTSDVNDSSLSTDSADSVITVISKNESNMNTPTKETVPTTESSFNIDQLKKEIAEAGKPLDDSADNIAITDENAATRIQSAFRGYRVRRDLPKTITEQRNKRKLFDIKEEQCDSKETDSPDEKAEKETKNNEKYGKFENESDKHEETSKTEIGVENVIKNCEDVIPDEVTEDNKLQENKENPQSQNKNNDSKNNELNSVEISNNKEDEVKLNINESNNKKPNLKEGDKEMGTLINETSNNEDNNTETVDVKDENPILDKSLPENTNISNVSNENAENHETKLPRNSDKVQENEPSIEIKKTENGEESKDEHIKKEDPPNEKMIERHLLSDENEKSHSNEKSGTLISNNTENDTKNPKVMEDSKNSVSEVEPKIEKIEKNVSTDPPTIHSVVALNPEPEPRIHLLHTGEFHDTVVIPLALSQTFNRPETSTESQTSNEEKVDNVTQTPVNRGEVFDSALPLAVQLNEAAPAGTEVVVTSSPAPASDRSVTNVDQVAQASNKDVLHFESVSPPDNTSTVSTMETEKRNGNNTEEIQNGSKEMEAEAAIKIQAGFRGYQVRKQLKMKNNSANENSSPRRTAHRKSASKLTTEQTAKSKSPKQSEDIEEQSAVKIQAGIRGFLVRRRQKKQKTSES